LLADHHAGLHGLRGPFLGHDCSTSHSVAVFAQRYNCDLLVSICYRVGIARWKVEYGEVIPTRENGKLRSPADIMREVNREFEEAVRRDPANWFWVHRRWKPLKSKRARAEHAGLTPQLPDKLQKTEAENSSSTPEQGLSSQLQ